MSDSQISKKHWIIFGFVGATLYGFLSGGRIDDYVLALVIVSLAVVILYCLYTPSAEEVVNNPNYQPAKFGDKTFWIFVAYFSLPIIMNGLSKLLWFLAFEKAGYWVFEFRHWSMVFVVMVATFIGWIIEACGKSVADSSD